MSIFRGANRTQNLSTITQFTTQAFDEKYDRQQLIKDLKQLLKENTFLRQQNLQLKQQIMLNKIEMENLKIQLSSSTKNVQYSKAQAKKENLQEKSFKKQDLRSKSFHKKYQSADLSQIPDFPQEIIMKKFNVCVKGDSSKTTEISNVPSQESSRVKCQRKENNKENTAKVGNILPRKSKKQQILARFRPILESEDDLDINLNDFE